MGRTRLNKWLTKLNLTVLHYHLQLIEEEAAEEIDDRDNDDGNDVHILNTARSASGGSTGRRTTQKTGRRKEATPTKDGGRLNSASPVRSARASQPDSGSGRVSSVRK